MIVYKFGGALARSKRGLMALTRILHDAVKRETSRARQAKHTLHGVVLVTSAIGHTTRHLARAAELAEEGKLRDAEELLARTIAQHEQLAASLAIENEAALFERFETISNEIGALFEGVAIVRELSPRTRDAILAAGETLAATLIHALLETEFHVRHIPSASVIVTDEQFGHAAPMMEEISKRAEKYIVPALRRGTIALVEGFSGATREGIVTTMGSESSDLTATLLAGALGAKEIVIWKMLPGLYTADPELIPAARLIRSMRFEEAEELGRRGARMLFPLFAQPLSQPSNNRRSLNAPNDAVLRIATPFSNLRGHTVLTHDAPAQTKASRKASRNASRSVVVRPLALALEERLTMLWIDQSASGNDAEFLRQRARYAWTSPEGTNALVRSDDRRAALRDLADRGIPFREGPMLAALALIVRGGSSVADASLLAAMARGLRSVPIHAIIPVGESLIAFVEQASAHAALRALHRVLFEK